MVGAGRSGRHGADSCSLRRYRGGRRGRVGRFLCQDRFVSEHGLVEHGREDQEDQRCHRADEREGLHAVLVRPGHEHEVQLQRVVRVHLASGEGSGNGRPGRHRQAGHDQAVGRLNPGHLQRASAVHLRRRHGPGPGSRQRAQCERRQGHRAVVDRTRQAGLRRSQRAGLRVAGAGLLAATGGIHLDLYLTGYRSIPVIGWLFLLQVIAAFGLALAVLVSGSRLAAAAGAGFALSTLGGYLLSVWVGLFGFTEVRTTAGVVAGVVEVAAFAVLAALALAPATADTPAGGAAGTWAAFPDRIPPAAARAAATITAALAVVALVLLGVAVAGANPAPPAAAATGTALKTTTIGGTTVLTNAKGFTLYSFAPDTPASSKCYGSCAAYWPPVIGTAAAGHGLPGQVATITRTRAADQITYNGHPLYTYIGDTAPGQAHGNNLNLNGGLGHEVPASG